MRAADGTLRCKELSRVTEPHDKLKAALLNRAALAQVVDKLFNEARPYSTAVQVTCRAYFAYLEKRNARLLPPRKTAVSNPTASADVVLP